MNTKNLLLGVFVLLTITFASVTFIEYSQVGTLNSQIQSGQSKGTSSQILTTTTTVTSTTTVTQTSIQSTQSTLSYGVSNVTIPVPCYYPGCPNIPASFVVGNYLFRASSEGPPCVYSSHNGTATIATCVRVTFNVTTTEMIPPLSQIANFTWVGTFGPTPPYPANASVLNGNVRMNWFVNSSLLYLQITTKWPPTLQG